MTSVGSDQFLRRALIAGDRAPDFEFRLPSHCGLGLCFVRGRYC
jgi:hypothetical protein